MQRSDLGNGCFALGAMDSVDTIKFGPAVAGQTITTALGELPISNSVSINPGGINTTIDGNQQGTRVMTLSNGASVTMEQMTITGGDNGGIDVHAASLMMKNSIITGNSSGYSGGGIYANNSLLALSNSTVSDNTANYRGGGIYTYNNSSIMLTSSTVSGNTAMTFGGGISAEDSPVVILNSTVSGNTANNGGGGILALESTTHAHEQYRFGQYSESWWWVVYF